MLYHVTPARNLPRILKEGLAPRIGPRSRKLRERVPAVYFFDDPTELEDAITNWLGEEFSESTRIALLAVEPSGLTALRLTVSRGFACESFCTDTIPPSVIRVLSDNLDEVTDLQTLCGATPPRP